MNDPDTEKLTVESWIFFLMSGGRSDGVIGVDHETALDIRFLSPDDIQHLHKFRQRAEGDVTHTGEVVAIRKAAVESGSMVI